MKISVKCIIKVLFKYRSVFAIPPIKAFFFGTADHKFLGYWWVNLQHLLLTTRNRENQKTTGDSNRCNFSRRMEKKKMHAWLDTKEGPPVSLLASFQTSSTNLNMSFARVDKRFWQLLIWLFWLSSLLRLWTSVFPPYHAVLLSGRWCVFGSAVTLLAGYLVWSVTFQLESAGRISSAH